MPEMMKVVVCWKWWKDRTRSLQTTCFKRQDEHLITYRNGLHASQNGYRLLKQTDRKIIQDCRLIPEEAAVRQRRVLVITIQMQVKGKATKHTQKSPIRTWKLKCNLASFKQGVQKIL
jgi:hypothetical protein